MGEAISLSDASLPHRWRW